MSKKYTKEEILEDIRLCEKENGKVTTKLMRNNNKYVHPYYVKKEFDTFSKAKQKSGIDNVGQIHLSEDNLNKINDSINKNQQEILKGILMGDAWIDKPENKNARIAIESVKKEFLVWLDNKLGDITTGVRLKNTSSELANKNREHGYTVNEENYNDIYVLRSRALPYLNNLYEWYQSGEKRFPNIELTRITLKMWYVCDGSLVKNNYAVIYAANENDRKKFIRHLFDDLDLYPSFHGGGGGVVQFSKEDTKKLFEYIGEPICGFEYKWVESFK
jgi:hypothetical protein